MVLRGDEATIFAFVGILLLVGNVHCALVRAAGGVDVVAGVPFVPKVLFEGSYYPVCGHHFWDDQAGASTICRELGFPNGGLLTITNAIFDTDAMPVGRCLEGEALDSCTGPGNAWGDFDRVLLFGGVCTAGNEIGVTVTCSDMVLENVGRYPASHPHCARCNDCVPLLPSAVCESMYCTNDCLGCFFLEDEHTCGSRFEEGSVCAPCNACAPELVGGSDSFCSIVTCDICHFCFPEIDCGADRFPPGDPCYPCNACAPEKLAPLEFCDVVQCEPCLPCFPGDIDCTFGADDLESYSRNINGLDVEVFPSLKSQCGANAEGYFCVTLEGVDDSLEGCLEHCQGMLGDDLASVVIDRDEFGSCCCHNTHACQCSSALTEASAGQSLEVAMVNGHSLPSNACQLSLVSQGTVEQCRPFAYFTDFNLHTCRPYLSNASTYYLADSPVFDYAGGFISTFADEIVVSPWGAECTANLLSLICNSWFRTCQPVEDEETGETFFLPSLLCRDQCEVHRKIWDSCVAKVERNADTKQIFDERMSHLAHVLYTVGLDYLYKGHEGGEPSFPAQDPKGTFHLFDCDVSGGIAEDISAEDASIAMALGRWPHNVPPETFLFSQDFPPSMETSALYPEVFSMYVHKGTEYDVKCFTPRSDYVIDATICPEPYVSAKDDGDIPCVKPCPSPAYTDDEYTTMWIVASTVEMVGLCLNSFVAATWLVSEKNFFRQVPFQLKMCVFAGLLVGLVSTLPRLILKFDLACECETEECSGTSFLCALNRSTIYILLWILVNLCVITYKLCNTLEKQSSTPFTKKQLKIIDAISVLIPLLLMILGYMLDTDNTEVTNGILNVSRHAFSCSMRFPNMAMEWIFLWCVGLRIYRVACFPLNVFTSSPLFLLPLL